MKSLALALVLLSLPAGDARRLQEDEPPEDTATEGPLDNDVFVALDSEAAEALAEGDAALLRARDPGNPAAERDRQLDLALERWRGALVRSAPGAVVGPDPTAVEPRLTEGVHAAVLRRLSALEPAERRRWRERVGPEAAAALGAAREETPEWRERALALLVRSCPATSGAARAALALGDLALEAGLGSRARGWYAHAELAAELAEAADVLAAARSRAGRVARPAPAPEAWRTATRAEPAGHLAWREAGTRAGARADRRARPGAAFLPDGRVFLQGDDELVLVAADGRSAPRVTARATVEAVLGSPTEPLPVPLEPPGWPLLPAADASGVVLVAGRGAGNVLAALEVPPAGDLSSLGLDLTGTRPPPLRLAWAISGELLLDGADAAGRPLPALAELSDMEFQPGPVLSGDLVVAQARVFGEQVSAWLLAFDRRDGTPAWVRPLCEGADRVQSLRFGPQRRVAGQPLAGLEDDGLPLVFAGTHLGLGALLDPLLGEPLWTLRNRRRPEHAPGWSGDRPPLTASLEGPVRVLWGPMDSDRLYPLVPRMLARGTLEDVLAGPPLPLSEATHVLGGEVDETLVLGRSGKERTVSALRTGRDRIEALDLGRDEDFAGLGLVSAARAWVASNRGLYLMDRTRELYLLDYDTLTPVGDEPPGGDLYARGALVLVVGPTALWTFRAL